MFSALEGKLSSLVKTWTPLRRVDGRSKKTAVKHGGSGWDRMKERLKRDGTSGSLAEMAREILLSVADAGVNVEVSPATARV